MTTKAALVHGGGDAGSQVSHVGPGFLYFYHIHMYIYAMQKYFMILWNISGCKDGIFKFLRLHGKSFL